MKHFLDDNFKIICAEIISQNKSFEEWLEIESDDNLSLGNYSGGFDGTEMEFCFSVIIDETEYWFQLPLQMISEISNGTITEIDVREAE